MSDETACPLRRVETNRDQFYLDPDSVIGNESGRLALALSEYGTEVLAFDLVRGSFRDKRLVPRDLAYFERLGASPLILEFIRDGNLNFMAADKHDRIRPVLAKAMTPARVDAFRPRMRAIADELIDALLQSGRGDLVADFAHPYPIAVMAEFIGVPHADIPSFSEATVQLRMLGQQPFAPGMPILEGALTFLYDHVERLVAERRQNRRDDFVGALIALQEAGEKFSERELVWALVFLMLAGHDTTRYTLAGCFHSIIAAGFWDRLADDPALILPAIQESMRLSPGTPRQMRIAAEELELAGHRLAPGDVVSLNLAAAGRDPDAFESAGKFLCPRSGTAFDIGFGFGRHVCIGQLLARAEMAEAVGRLTSRLAAPRFAGDLRLKPTGVIAGYDALPVEIAARIA